VNLRLIADENTSHAFVSACQKLQPNFPIAHVVTWKNGVYRSAKDTTLLLVLREAGLILVGFDRSTMPMHAGDMTREGTGHAGVIIFRRSVPAFAFGTQSKLVVELWSEAKNWDWADRIEYLPRP
jgi:hypothetical protein